MFETLGHLLEARGQQSKAIVWAHNSHIGDARFTDMGVVREELNIGKLCRERFGRDATLIGFGTHTGTVAAATDWDGDMEVKQVRPSHRDSYERVCHDAGIPRFLLDLNRDEALHRRLLEPRLERFIGVIYRPDTELMSHYSAASLPQQFDAYVWFDETNAVLPLGPEFKIGRSRNLSIRAVNPLLGARNPATESGAVRILMLNYGLRRDTRDRKAGSLRCPDGRLIKTVASVTVDLRVARLGLRRVGRSALSLLHPAAGRCTARSSGHAVRVGVEHGTTSTPRFTANG